MAFVLALLAWITSLWPAEPQGRVPEQAQPNVSAATPPTEHDLQLLQRFRTCVDGRVRQTLREHDFGGAYFGDWLSELSEISSWQSAEYTFDNDEVQTQFAPILESTRKFAVDLALASHEREGRTDLYSIVPSDERDWHSPETREIVAKINAQATDLIEAIDAFIRFARVRVGGKPL